MFEERLLLPGDCVLEMRIDEDRNFLLSYRKGKKILVEYGSAGRYQFKSVEKLRYDFERAVEDALRSG